MNQSHQHFPYGRYFQLEHFVLLIKRCRICDEFVGCETMPRPDLPKQEPVKQEPLEPGTFFDEHA